MSVVPLTQEETEVVFREREFILTSSHREEYDYISNFRTECLNRYYNAKNFNFLKMMRIRIANSRGISHPKLNAVSRFPKLTDVIAQ